MIAVPSLEVCLFAALVIGSGWYLAVPFAGHAPPDLIDGDDTVMLRREQLVSQLRELDFDYRMGKVLEHDYGPLKRELQKQLSLLLSESDAGPA